MDAGAEGLTKAEWAPDGRSILCFSQWGLRVTIWSLVSATATYMQFPIHPDRGYAFRSDGRYFILAERHKSKDTLGVYDAVDSFKLVRHFALPTSALASFAISPTGNHIAAWEGSLEVHLLLSTHRLISRPQYKLIILTLTGDILATFTPHPDPGFGIRNVAWHPSGNFLAVSGWEPKIHILDRLSWTSVATLELAPQVPSGVKIWREPSRWLESIEGRGFLSYEKLDGPQFITITRNTQSKAQPKSGAVQLEWNKTGDLLIVRFENTPTAVHIFQFPSSNEQFAPKLRSILIHNQPVLRAQWNPVRKGSLALCCGKSCLYTWSEEWLAEAGTEEEMAECVGIPAKEFDTRDFKWSPDGKAIILLDKDTFCCAFEVQDS